MEQKRSEPFYHTAAWKRVREQRLMYDGYMCVECMAEFRAGGVRPQRATLVHHVIPYTQRPDLALDIDNLRSLCDMHHNREHPEKGGQGRAAVGRTDNATRTGMRVIKV